MNQNNLSTPSETGFIYIQSTELLYLENELALVGSRALAFIIDSVVKGLCMVLLIVYTQLTDSMGPAFIIFLMIIWVGYHVVLEAVTAGKTPGKHLVGIRVVKADGTRISTLDSIIRNVLRLVDMMPVFYMTGIIVVFFERYNRRLGDVVADTLVIYDRQTSKSIKDVVESRIIQAQPNFSIKVNGIEKLSETEKNVIKNLYVRMENLSEKEKQKILRKLLSKLYPRVTVEGTDDVEIA